MKQISETNGSNGSAAAAAGRNGQTNGSASEAKPSTRSEWVWERMSDLYGRSKWRREYGDNTNPTWMAMLERFHAEQIKAAVVLCAKQYPDYVVSLGQFRQLCAMSPNPEAPPALPTPPQSEEEIAREWIEFLAGIVAEKAEQGPMHPEERQRHLKTLGLLEPKKPGYFQPGSYGACSYPGCSGPGALAHPGGMNWYCRNHFSG